MKQILPILIGFMISMLANGASNSAYYQIDVIGFTHPQNTASSEDLSPPTPVIMHPKNRIKLNPEMTESLKPYTLRPWQTSQLKKEYATLKAQPEYQILFRYTWLQPIDNSNTVSLPSVSTEDWDVEGTLRVRQSNYFIMDTELYFSPTNSKQPAFVFNQKQRLKEDTVYYLDHPQAGLLIKIHPIS